jgi:hypothetical protein
MALCLFCDGQSIKYKNRLNSSHLLASLIKCCKAVWAVAAVEHFHHKALRENS